MRSPPTFEEYVATLGRLTDYVNPLEDTAEAREIKSAAASLAALTEVSCESLAGWIKAHPRWTPVLGLAAGISQEKLKNWLQHTFASTGWITLARNRSDDLIRKLDEDYDVVGQIERQRGRSYEFGDVLVARAGTRGTANRAGKSGRKVEDEIENVAASLKLPYKTRTRFEGRSGTAPCDLAILKDNRAVIAVAAKGFDSTGSKLTDAVREIESMAAVRLPTQFIMAVIDGIGWKSRIADLRRIYQLWETHQLDGMYTLGDLQRFREDLTEAAKRVGLLVEQ